MIKKALQYMKIGPTDTVLHIGMEDGILIDLTQRYVKECHGIHTRGAVVQAIARKYRGLPNVLLQQASPVNLPFPGSYFSRILLPELCTALESKLEVRRALDEMRRVSAADAILFIGGVSMAEERQIDWRFHLRNSITQYLRRTRRPQRAIRWPVDLIHRFLKWILQKLNRTPSLVFSEDEFLSLCRQYLFQATAMRTELIHALSTSRNDFLLRPIAVKQPEGVREVSERSEKGMS